MAYPDDQTPRLVRLVLSAEGFVLMVYSFYELFYQRVI